MQLITFIKRIKRQPLSFNSFFFTLLTIVIVRTFLEFILESSHQIILIQDFYLHIVDYIHIVCSWLTLFLVITYILHLFNQETLLNTLKISLFFFPIIIIVPLLDYFIFESGQILYEGSFKLFWYKFFHLFNPFVSNIPNITNGVRVEIFLVIVNTFIYILLETKKISKALLASLSIYTAIFIFGFLPAVLNFLNQSSSFSDIIRHSILQSSTTIHLTFYMYLPILIVLTLLFLQKLINKQYLYTIIDSFRLNRLSIYIGLFLFGLIMSLKRGLILDEIINISDTLKIASAILALSFGFSYATILNNINDIKTDKISNPQRPLIKKFISLDSYLLLQNILFGLCLTLSFTVTPEFFFIMMTILSLSYLYSGSAFRYKKYIFISSILLSTIAVLVFLAGYTIVEGNRVLEFIDKPILVLIFLFFFVASNLKDIKDIQGDNADNVTTLATLLGIKKSMSLIKLSLWIVLGGTLYFFNFNYMMASFLLFFYGFIFFKVHDSEKVLLYVQALVLCIYLYFIFQT